MSNEFHVEWISTHLSLLRGIDQVHDNVQSLNDATKYVDGDEEVLICLYERIVDPQHGTEQRNDIRQWLEAFGRFLFVDSIESWSASN